MAQTEANGAVTYMHTDRQASVVAITDAAGNVVSRRGYGSYGETDSAQLVGTGSHPFGYTGRRWDPDLGIYYYRARWYDPTTGTFLQTDPIGSLDYVNLYAYVGLEPGNATDPTGMQFAEGLYHGLYMAKVESQGGPTVEKQVRQQAKNDLPIAALGVAAASGFGCVAGGCEAIAASAILNAPRLAMAGEQLITAYTPGGTSVIGLNTAAAQLGIGSAALKQTIAAQRSSLGFRYVVIAGPGSKKAVDQAARLALQYGGDPGDWQKIKGFNQKFPGGGNVEIHAFRNGVTGEIVEPKFRFHWPTRKK